MGGFVQCLPVAAAFVGRRVLMGGMSTDCGLFRRVPGPCEYASPFGGVGKRWSGSVSGRVHGALLGPETTGPRPSAHVPHGCAGCVVGGSVVCLGCPRAWPRPAGSGIPFLGGCWWWGVGVLGLLFGNCIVDASILYRGTPFVVFPVQIAISLI